MRILLPVGITASALVASHAFVAPSSRSARHQFALSATDIKGTVKWYNPERGFGFIEVDEGGPDMYVHATGLLFDGPLIEEERVSFITEIDSRTNKPKAVEVERIAAEEVVLEEAEPEPVAEAPVEEAPVVEEPAKTVVATILAGPVKQKLPVATPPDETFQRSLLEAQIANKAPTQAAKTVTATILSGPVKQKLPVATPPDEAFQRSLLEAQLANKAPTQAASPFQSVDYDSAARLAYEAAGESGDFDAFKAKYLEDASAMVGDKYKAAAEADAAEAKAKAEAAEAARLAKEAEEKRLAEEAAAAEAKAKAEAEAAEAARLAEEAAAAKAKAEAEAAEAARLAEEKRLAEEAAAAEALQAEVRELGYPSVAVMKARQQPKSAEEEAALASKYGAMDLEERAFSILTDLGMIDLNPDPEDPNRDTSKDDDDME
eukprot:CAMPEP_0113398824 /NCGR_PEP_ID=MMETSP0013_2-20120614/15191_1 /TAXON_ID=2843 ORGANISM="Skeletonema costatum, Strain 1716" /NCGR_SAMPLE_ID=MMETSP0013_2 /ASSEMBLY_ACC=CAM_ASM_000158 /LENGTH=432 /DNA_ID=CAMNT_0000283643 /DNA_START=109 /DNA_END=1407 /DNA_ORIENTATION=- /assembly_acc=CAM_ASM_000158